MFNALKHRKALLHLCVGQPGRQPCLERGSRWFKSTHTDHFFDKYSRSKGGGQETIKWSSRK